MRIESSPLFLPSTILRSAATRPEEYGSLAGGLGRRAAERAHDDRPAGARLDRRLVDRFEIPGIGARSVDTEERDGHSLLHCERHRVDDPLEHRLPVDAEGLELQVGDGRL